MDGYTQEHTLDTFWLDKLLLFIRYRRTLLWTALTMEGVDDRYRAELDGLRHEIVSDAPIQGFEAMFGK